MAKNRWGGKSGLVIALSTDSTRRLQALAAYPDLRADHVTLAYGVERDGFDPAWIPGGYAVGATVPLKAIGMVQNGRVQALLLEVAGSTHRPWDGARLHVTVSKQPYARSSESNALLDTQAAERVEIPLEGVVRWDD